MPTLSLPTLTTRARWLIGGAVAVVAVAVVALAVVLLGARPLPEALSYLPADSVVVAEVRADLPGDQLGHLGNLLAHFPGFADQSTLGTKLDQTLDRLLSDNTNGATTYTRDVKPWLAGPAFAGLAPPSGTAGAPPTSGAGAVAAQDGLVVTTTDGSVTCERVLGGTAGASETYLGVTIAKDATGTEGCAFDGRYALLGSPARIRAGLDAHRAALGMDHDAAYLRARDALGGDRLATVYVSSGAVALAAVDPSIPLSAATGLTGVPAWAIAGIRAEDDALVADLVVAPTGPGTEPSPAIAAPAVAAATLPPPHASQVAGFVPADAILLAEVHGVGPAAENAVAALAADPQFQAAASQLDAALGAAGGPSAIVGWIDDAAVVVLPDHTGAATPGLTAGLALVAQDEATASAKAQQLRTLLGFAALSSGHAPVDEVVEGVTVTTVDLGTVGSLLQLAGNAGGAGSLGGLPISTDTEVTVTVAARGRLILFGGDDGFARAMLGVEAGSTLAEAPAYRHAIARGAEQNLGEVYLAGVGLRDLADRFIPADQLDHWRTDLLPYAAPVESLLITTTTSNGLSRTRIVVTVTTPAPAGSSTP